jgi:hypothetical protein
MGEEEALGAGSRKRWVWIRGSGDEEGDARGGHDEESQIQRTFYRFDVVQRANELELVVVAGQDRLRRLRLRASEFIQTNNYQPTSHWQRPRLRICSNVSRTKPKHGFSHWDPALNTV